MGCTAISEERTTPGGIFGAEENQYLFQVDTNFGYLYRVTYITAVLAEVGEQNIRNEGNAALAIAQINGLTQTITNLYTLAVFPCGAPSTVTTYPMPYNIPIYTDVIPPEQRPSGADTSLIELTDPASSTTELSSLAEGGECPEGLYRTRFEVNVSQLDPQVLSLAYAALPENEFKTLINDASHGKTISVLSDVVTSFWKLAIDAHYAFAVNRQQKQLWSYILNYDGDGFKNDDFRDGTFIEAYQKLNYAVTDSKNVDNPWVYRTALYSLFQDIQQSCYNIQKQLPVNKTTLDANTCPRTFLPRMDVAGYILLERSASAIDSSNNPINLYSVAAQCVPTDNINFDFTDDSIIKNADAYACDSVGDPSAYTIKAPPAAAPATKKRA